MSNPLICLVMIVKDEARGIVETIESVHRHVDATCILDTGSNDDTTSLVWQTWENLDSGFNLMSTADFVDFATTRNLALDFAAVHVADLAALTAPGAPTWLLMVSGDAIVERPELLREVVERAEADGCIAARVRLRSTAGLTFTRTDLVKAWTGCHYEGAVHELMNVPGKAYDAGDSGFVIRYTCNPERDQARWPRDLLLLERELAEAAPARPPRTVFYLAQTYECLGDNARAAELYAERVDLVGYDGERFIAQLRLARCLWRIGGRNSEVIEGFRRAAHMCPDRAEPMHDLAKFFGELGQWKTAHYCAEVAAALPVPPGAPLFLERDVYESAAKDRLANTAYRLAHPAPQRSEP